MAQSENAQEKEVASEEKVDVLLGEYLEEDVEPEERARRDQREHQRVLVRHRLVPLTRLLEGKRTKYDNDN